MIENSPQGRRAFILAHTKLLPVPHATEISLHVADDSTALWLKTEEELGEMGLPPPFWAFAWAGGQALARYILDHPETVRSKRVLDFASGSGLVAIAAAIAGASHVTACDIDPFAVTAVEINAMANKVQIETELGNLIGKDGGWDIVLAGDISYEKDMAHTATDWLADLHASGTTVLIGDPGRSYLARDRLENIATYSVPVSRDLEDAEVKKSSVWRFK
jgi:predicted nicotinamide N-methyase